MRTLVAYTVFAMGRLAPNQSISNPGISFAYFVNLVFPGSSPRVFAKVQNAWKEKGPYDSIEEGIEYGVLLPQDDELDSALITPLPGKNKRRKAEKSNSPGSQLYSYAAFETLIDRAYCKVLANGAWNRRLS